jgi:hypothetical protein
LFERFGKTMAREDRQHIEHREARAIRRGEVDPNRVRILRGHGERQTVDAQAARQRAVDALVIERAEREQHIVGRKGRAVREADTRAQVQAVGRRAQGVPSLGEPGHERPGGPVHLDQRRMNQRGNGVNGCRRGDEPVECFGLGAERGDERRGLGRISASREPPSAGQQEGDKSNARNEFRESSQKLTAWMIS